MWKIKSHGELVMECDNVTLLAPADGFNKFFEGSKVLKTSLNLVENIE